MRARIIEIDYQKGYCIFERDDGEYGWFEVLGDCLFEIDDYITGDLNSLGGISVFIDGSNNVIDIYVQDFCSLELAQECIRNLR